MYKLLQDINYPNEFVPQGTIGEVYGGYIRFGENSIFHEDYIKNSPDWFEEVPKWTDEDMLKFGEYIFTELWGSWDGRAEKIKKMFDDFLE